MLTCCIGVFAAPAEETYLQMTADSRKQVESLNKIVSIDNIVGDTVYAYANPAQLDKLQAAGYQYTVLPHPSSLYDPIMHSDKDTYDFDAYPTYGAYVSMMEQYATNYPSICVLDTIGTTIEGRLLLVAKISDNAAIEEAEPEVFYTATMHGDETAGYVMTLRFMDSLLTTYGSDSRVTTLVDELEIFINPAANPDGTYASGDNTVSGATRGNANGVDLNRNFPDPEDGQNPDGNSWQPETMAMMAFAEDHNIILSANYHGGAEVMNYPWDTWSQRHADDDWWQLICHEYADLCQANSPSGYMDGFNDGITNGYDWYTISGGRQDFMTYFHGGREVTMEISNTKLLPESQLEAWWGYHRLSMLAYLEQAYYGIRGLVTDASTGDPVGATIRAIGHDIDNSEVFADPDFGDYYRMIKAGTYTLEFSAPGYYPDTVNSVTVADYSSVTLDMQLTPLPDEPVLSYVSQNAGLVQSGETVSFQIALTNSGAGNANSVVGQLATDDTLVTVTTASALWPSITALGGTEYSSSDFVIQTDPNTPEEYVVPFELALTATGGYVDTVTFEMRINAAAEDFESGDFTSFGWTNGGDADWIIDTSDPYEGSYAARSGDIGDGQTSELIITLDNLAEDSISFYYKVSSESGYDYLRFYIDGIEQGEWAGSVDWTMVSYPTDSGSHTFRWAFEKDGSVSSGADAGWIDLISFPAVDSDKDGDGFANSVDNCPDTYNPDQADPDNDGFGTLCDNCPDTYNPDQKDDNDNGIGNACECCQGLTGNVNGDAQDDVDLPDVIYLVNALFLGGPAPSCPEEANVNGDANGDIDLPDVIYLVNYLFLGGAPLAPCQ
ncbi:hypothetical protein GF420_14675 [candidate division GN15 bacterium]|nr:hypothetical protein [candidate division GN15 bacterium]